MSGELIINDRAIKIVVFKNTNKASEKHPDYRILLSKEKKEGLTVEE